MKRLMQRLSSLLIVFFVAGFSLATHASAMPIGSSDMGGMNHNSGSSSINCATLCSNNIYYKDEQVLTIREDEDDEPIEPYYVLFRTLYISTEDTTRKLYAVGVKPPPKVPIYIRLGVFRV